MTAPTIERVRELRHKFELVTRAKGEQLSLEHLEALSDQLEGPLDGVDRHLGRCRALAASVETSHREGMFENLKRLKTQYMEAPQEVGQGTVFADFKGLVIETGKALGRSAEGKWTELRAEALGRVPLGLLDFWESIPALRADAEKLRSDVSSLRDASRPPSSAEACQGFMELCARISEHLERLMQFDAPPSVRRFVIAATTSHGAPWESLTDEVRDWLSENEMLEKLRLRL